MARGRMWLISVLLVALVLRLAAAFAVQQRVGGDLCLIPGDAQGYWELAQNIAAGADFSLYVPPRRIHRMPGFPAVLALSMSFFGESRLPARCVLALIGTAACGAVYLLGRRLFDQNVGLLACALTAVSPVMVGFSVLFLSETLFSLTLTLSAWLAANWLAPGDRRRETESVPSVLSIPLVPSMLLPGNREQKTASWIWAFATGIGIAAATYVRPSWLLAGPGLAGLAVLLSRRRAKTVLEATVMLLGLFGALAPWAMRNHGVCGHWVFTTLWSGPSLYDGLHPEATGESDMRFFDRDNLMAVKSEWDVDQHYKDAAWQFARANPGRAIELTLIKLWRYWKPWPNAAQFGGVGPAFLVAVFFVPVFVLAIRGCWLTRARPWAWLLTVGPILYFAAIHAVFVGSLRYRLPAEYPLCVLAAAACRRRLTGDS